jgi:hybrid cluster-associated redox disulfide protein
LKIIDIIVGYYQKNADIERVGQFIDRIGFAKFKNDVLAEFNDNAIPEEIAKPYSAGEKIIPKPGGLTEGTLVFGDPISAESVIADIIRVYPQTISVLRSFGMGCLGCPSAAGEALTKAADIHGIDVNELIASLNKVAVRGEQQ